MTRALILLLTAGATALGAGLASADHLDDPAAVTTPTADITDLYAWMARDGSRLNLILNVFDGAPDDVRFTTEVQYVFHIASAPSYGGRQVETLIQCQFYKLDGLECWIDGGRIAYLSGDPSAVGGVASDDGRFKAFAARVDDPFYFDADAFDQATEAFAIAADGAPRDDAGCPELADGAAAQITDLLDGGENTFAGSAVQALVLQLDPALVTPGGPVIGVWASTRTRGGTP